MDTTDTNTTDTNTASVEKKFKCAICLELYGKLDTDITYTPCIHGFHTNCINNYINSIRADLYELEEQSILCPVCKTDISGIENEYLPNINDLGDNVNYVQDNSRSINSTMGFIEELMNLTVSEQLRSQLIYDSTDNSHLTQRGHGDVSFISGSQPITGLEPTDVNARSTLGQTQTTRQTQIPDLTPRQTTSQSPYHINLMCNNPNCRFCRLNSLSLTIRPLPTPNTSIQPNTDILKNALDYFKKKL